MYCNLYYAAIPIYTALLQEFRHAEVLAAWAYVGDRDGKARLQQSVDVRGIPN